MARIERSALPNIITTARILVAPVVFWLVFVRGFWTGVLTFLLFLAAALSDLWDGYLARKHGWISDYGKLVDPIADKLLVVATLVPIYILSHRPGPVGAVPFFGVLPAWVLVVIFGREIVITAVRAMAAKRGIIIPAGKAGKHKAVFQNIFVGSVLVWYALRDAELQYGWEGAFWEAWQVFHTVVVVLTLTLSIALTLYSMAVYLWNWRRLVRELVS